VTTIIRALNRDDNKTVADEKIAATSEPPRKQEMIWLRNAHTANGRSSADVEVNLPWHRF
jgi:hypothetical protein